MRCLRRSGRAGAAAILLTTISAPTMLSGTASASMAKVVPECSYDQLEVGVVSGSGAAAGNIGVPFLIANISKTTCTLRGYPRLSFTPDSFRGHKLKVIDGGGMIYVAVAPRLVVVKPGADASFGLNYGDAANQGDPNGGACLIGSVNITLPVRPSGFPRNYEALEDFNLCYTGFEVSVTSIESGPLPKQA